MELRVNSYHHQGVKRLAHGLAPMAFAPDGLIEAFYDPNAYNPKEGEFIVGLQFHPERMRRPYSNEFDYPGCPSVYKEFAKAATAYQKKLNCLTRVPLPIRSGEALKEKKRIITKESELVQALAKLLNESKSATDVLSNGCPCIQGTMREKLLGANYAMGKMSAEELSDLMAYYRMMGQICEDVLDRKLPQSQ